MKHLRLAATCSVPGYKESCISIFTEESRLTGDFCPSISGIVTTPAVGSRATARFDAVDVVPAYSLARIPASTRRLTCLCGRRTKACTFGVLCTVLRCSCVGHSEQRLLTATFGFALSAFDLHHPVQGVPCTVSRRFRTCNFERR